MPDEICVITLRAPSNGAVLYVDSAHTIGDAYERCHAHVARFGAPLVAVIVRWGWRTARHQYEPILLERSAFEFN